MGLMKGIVIIGSIATAGFILYSIVKAVNRNNSIFLTLCIFSLLLCLFLFGAIYLVKLGKEKPGWKKGWD